MLNRTVSQEALAYQFEFNYYSRAPDSKNEVYGFSIPLFPAVDLPLKYSLVN